MGYFPLPELKGKPNRIFVDGKTLNQIAKESGIRLDTVQHRYSRGIRDYEGLTKPSHIRVEHEKTQRKTYSIMSAGERVMERIWELDIPLQTISDKTGISTGLLDIEWGNGRKERFKSNGYEYHRSSGYGRTSFYLEPYTEERGRQVIQENKRKCMVGWLKEFDYTKLSYEEAEQVYTLVAGLKNS